MTSTPAAQQRAALPLPLHVEDVTPQWLEAALRSRFGEVLIESVSPGDIIWGTATKAFFTITYAQNVSGAPESVCVKAGFDEKLRAFGAGPAYELESAFYRDLAPTLDIPLPKAYYADAEQNRQGVIVLEDLRRRDVSFGHCLSALTADEAASALEVLASLHAQTWGIRPGRFDWLTVGAASIRGPVEFLLQPAQFDALAHRAGLPSLSGSLADPSEVLEGYRRMWAYGDAGEHALSHADAHVGQTYREADGTLVFLDWQGVCLGHWANDVAYFMTGALETEVRRASERDLLALYGEALAAGGGPDLSADELWTDYRRHALHGYVWQITPTEMQPIETVAAMAARHVAAVDDLDSLNV